MKGRKENTSNFPTLVPDLGQHLNVSGNTATSLCSDPSGVVPQERGEAEPTTSPSE